MIQQQKYQIQMHFYKESVG